MAASQWAPDAGSGELLTRGESACVNRAVRELLGPDQKVIGVEKKRVVVQESEVIMVNGNSIQLNGEEGERIKSCLLSGKLAEYPQLLNQLLQKAGLIVTSDSVQADSHVQNSLTTRQTVAEMSNDDDGKRIVHEVTERSTISNSRRLDWKEVTNAAADVPPPTAPTSKPKPAPPALVMGTDGTTVASGTLDELIDKLVPKADSLPSETFQFSFLLSSRLFLTPTRLLHRVLRRADQLSHMSSTASRPAFVGNLVTMLQRWMVSFPMDFREESALQPTKRLARLAIDCHPPSETKINQLLHTLHTHLHAIEKHEKQLELLKRRQLMVISSSSSKSGASSSASSISSCASSAASPPSCGSSSSNFDLLTMPSNPVTFAQELTRLELEYLCFLGPEELVNSFATSSSTHVRTTSSTDVSEARQRAAAKTQNLNAYVAWFNRLSYLVATTVCQKSKKKLRVKTIEFWIEVARQCINYANFNSLMAIITGLNMTPVRRLRRTWLKIQSGKFTVLEHQMDPTSNFLSYRSTLKAAVSRSVGATDKVQRVVIPFFSLLLKDLYFVDQLSRQSGEDGHLNFEKFLKLGDKLAEFARWKDVECPYQKVSSVCDFLQLCPILSDEALDFESYECENPELQEEKERYKMLKQQLKKDFCQS